MRVKGKGPSPGKVIQIDPSPRFGWSGQYLGGWALIRDVTDQSADIERTLRQERELYTLYTIASTLSRGSGLAPMVEAASAALREQLGVDATCTWVRGDGATMQALGARGTDDRALADSLVEIALEWCEEVPASKPAIVVRDTSRSRNPHARAMGDLGYRSIAAIPLMAGSERIGFLWLACHDSSVMTRTWVSLLISIGHQLGLAVANAQGVEARLREEARQKQFYRDAVCAITNGKLSLVDRSELIAIMKETRELGSVAIQNREDVQEARKLAERVLKEQGFGDERIFDIATCVTEAATNTLLHGGGGTLRITTVPPDHAEGARIALEDQGPGINFSELPSAILKRGYSTAISMGLGYTLILDMMDAVYLATDGAGTSLVMEAAQNPVNAELEAWLAKVSD
jgi:anti-sigma regulatory factor (Ser/Thr protein kinase)